LDLITALHVVMDMMEQDIVLALQFAIQVAPMEEFALFLTLVIVQEQDIMEVFVNMILTSV